MNPYLGFALLASKYQEGGLKIGRVAQSHLHGMSGQLESPEGKGRNRQAKLGHPIQGCELRIKTKPSAPKDGELDRSLNKNNGRAMIEAGRQVMAVSHIRQSALLRSSYSMESWISFIK